MQNYKIEIIKELANKLKSKGFTVYLSKNKDYGFYTDDKKQRLISFQCDLGSISLSGNYKAIKHNEGRQIGSGWKIKELTSLSENFHDILYSCPPNWAVDSIEFRYKTISEYLEFYGRSSGFVEYV